MAASRIEGEPVRTGTDRDPRDQLLVRAAEDADARCGAIGREQQVVLGVDEHAGDAWEVRQRAQVRVVAAVDDVDRILRGVRDVEPAARRIQVRVRVIEAGALAAGQRDEADRREGHAGFGSTFFWQYAYRASRTGRDASRCFWSSG